jgi:ABC-type transporter Mla maintaining outer membrane lipid asymmetry ATPase subunit MlaF
MTSVALEIDGLRRRYGTVTALDGLSFDVPPGQVFGFLGPNGAGKTTTMRHLRRDRPGRRRDPLARQAGRRAGTPDLRLRAGGT